MEIVFDENKRKANVEKHGLDFADLDLDFFGSAATFPVEKGRFMAVGLFRSTAIAVVFSVLGSEAISIVSMRPASRKERRIL
ncbi:BrnT family toxin [Rhizobium sp. PAMB 3182]